MAVGLVAAGVISSGLAGCGTVPRAGAPVGPDAPQAMSRGAASPLSLRPLANLPQTGRPAPELDVVDLAGERVTLADKQGYGVIVNFFTTWCPTCQTELPILARQRSDCG